MKKRVLFVFFLLTSFILAGQQPVQELGKLPDVVSETSGLIFHNGKLITQNDSGNTPQLFEIDTVSLEVVRTVTITNVENSDWEDIAQDEKYIYIGDFGNNRGLRNNLAIYRVAKSDFDATEEVAAETIAFSYEDQVDFQDTGNSDWDAEALFVLNEKLIVLTKQWKSKGTVAYSVPKTPGKYTAERMDAYDVEGLVTGATYNPFTKKLVLVGYSTTLQPFLYQVTDINEIAIFAGTMDRTDLGIGLAQVEGVAYISTNNYLLSSEAFASENAPVNLPSTLYSLHIEPKSVDGPEGQEENQDEAEDELDGGGTVEDEEAPEDPQMNVPAGEKLLLHRLLDSRVLNYRLNVEDEIQGLSIFDSSGRRILYHTSQKMDNKQLDVSTFIPGIYFFTVQTSKEVISKAFAIED